MLVATLSFFADIGSAANSQHSNKTLGSFRNEAEFQDIGGYVEVGWVTRALPMYNNMDTSDYTYLVTRQILLSENISLIL